MIEFSNHPKITKTLIKRKIPETLIRIKIEETQLIKTITEDEHIKQQNWILLPEGQRTGITIYHPMMVVNHLMMIPLLTNNRTLSRKDVRRISRVNYTERRWERKDALRNQEMAAQSVQ